MCAKQFSLNSGRAMARTALAAFCAVGLISVLTGCARDNANVALDAGRVTATSGQPVKFESEQVSVTYDQVNCGVKNGLFEEPSASSGRKIAALTERARQLGFTDDVSIEETGHERPYTQVRGTFPVVFRQVVNIADEPKGAKRVEAWAGLKIDHFCFPGPLQIMGVRRGALTEAWPAAFEFAKNEEGWHLIQILHQ